MRRTTCNHSAGAVTARKPDVRSKILLPPPFICTALAVNQPCYRKSPIVRGFWRPRSAIACYRLRMLCRTPFYKQETKFWVLNPPISFPSPCRMMFYATSLVMEGNMTLQIYSTEKVCQTLGISRATLHRLSKTPDFPKKIHLTMRRVGFSASELTEWIQSRKEVNHENY